MKVLGHHIPLPIALLVGVEFLVGAGAILAVAVVFGVQIDADSMIWAVSFGLAVIVGVTAVGLYQTKQRLGIEGVVARIAVAVALGTVLLAVVDFVIAFQAPRRVWVAGCLLTVVALSVVRALLWRFLDHEVFQRRVLVCGAGRRAASLMKLRRRSDRRGFNIVAFLPVNGDARCFDDPRVIEIPGSIRDFAAANQVDEIVVAMDDRRAGFPIAELLSCRFAGIAVVDLLTFLERETGKINVDLVNPSWLIFSESLATPTRLRVMTRALDLLVVVPFAILALPIMCLVALAVLIDDGAPIFYSQTRTGLMGKPFRVYKFRSMIRDAEVGKTPQWAQKSDPRVTRIGGILRKLRLDELPQLFNVLVGTMSLVGPRPERPEFVDRLSQKIPYYNERHVVKPGITGWAQLCYPYGASDQDALEKLQYDLYYIKHKSIIFDLIVLLQTAEVVLWGKGAR